MQLRDVFAALMCLTLVGLAGCWQRNSQTGGTASSPVEFDAGPDIALTAAGGQVHVTPEGTSDVQGALQADIPVYKRATFSLTSKSSGAAFASYHVNMPAGEVAKFYLEELAKNGWQIESRRQSAAEVITAAKENRRLVVSIADGEGGGSRVTLSKTGMN